MLPYPESNTERVTSGQKPKKKGEGEEERKYKWGKRKAQWPVGR